MTAVLAPNPRQRFFDSMGNPLSGGKLYSYAANSATLKATFADATGIVPNPNPVILDVNGECDLWLPPDTGYKFRLTDANDVTQWTVDNITATGSQVVTVTQWISPGFAPTYITPTSFSVNGDKRDTFQVNRRFQATCTAGTFYGTIADASFSSNTTTVTVTLDSGSLDNGLSIVNVGLLTPLNDAIPRTYALKTDFSQLFSTGDAKLTLKNTPDAGWIMANDGTIGNAGSGASNRANADCQALFTLLWNNVSDTYAPVTGGRGASASVDWAANKVIALTKTLGRALGVAGSGAGLTARALGSTVGEETHALSVNELAAHSHSIATQQWGGSFTNQSSGLHAFSSGNFPATDYTDNAGGGAAHNNMQPTSFWNVMIKL